jgi:hypothetical protein
MLTAFSTVAGRTGETCKTRSRKRCRYFVFMYGTHSLQFFQPYHPDHWGQEKEKKPPGNYLDNSCSYHIKAGTREYHEQKAEVVP